MVNVRKIGAIATGALFVGATFGMAAAVDVPTSFKSSYLASGGVAKAQLVVGADAPGKTADTESAKEIQDAVKANLAATIGGDIQITYGSDDIDDDTGTTDRFASTNREGVDIACGSLGDFSCDEISTSNDDVDGEVIDLNGGIMKFDMNGDLKLDDVTDYPLYSGLYVIDKTTVQPYLDASVAGVVDDGLSVNSITVFDSTQEDTKYGAGYLGKVMKLRGTKYIIVKETDNSSADLAPMLEAGATDIGTGAPKDYSVALTGNLKVAYETEVAGKNGTLYFFEGDSLKKSLPVGDGSTTSTGPNGDRDGDTVGAIKKDKLPDAFAGLKVFYKIVAGSDSITVVAGERSAATTINNAITGALGYNTIYLNLGTGDNDEFSKFEGGIFLMGDSVSLVKGDKVDMPDTLFELDLSIANALDLMKKETVSVSSGAKLKSTSADYSDFLEQTIVVSTTGGTAVTEGPELAIVDETEADTSMNMVLIGGPVANTLTSDLVTNGKSKVDWHSSTGDVEVIYSGLKAGKYTIIVAGQDRVATKDAAVAVAGELA